MKATLTYHNKELSTNGDIIEIKIWKVPVTPDKPHGFKYSLVFIHGDKRVIGYDNSEQKGDHRHIGNKELKYKFKSIKKLFEDFQKDVEKFKKGELHKWGQVLKYHFFRKPFSIAPSQIQLSRSGRAS